MANRLKTIIWAVVVFALINIFVPLGSLRAEGFALPDLDGKAVDLGSFKGRQAVILIFWTTWCPYCREALKELNDKHEQFVKDGVEVLAINVGEPQGIVSNYIKNHKIILNVLLDKDTEVAHGYGILGVPTYIYLDKAGEVFFNTNSFSQDKYKELISR